MAHAISSLVDKNAFDSLSVHSGDASPPCGPASGAHAPTADAMEVDRDSSVEDQPRLSAADKGKQKAARVRSASEASLSPPPPASRPFTTGGSDAVPMFEEGQCFSPYNIMEQDASDNEGSTTGVAEGTTGFMADARRATVPSQTPADRAIDFLLAVALQEEDARPQRANATPACPSDGNAGTSARSYSNAVTQGKTSTMPHAASSAPKVAPAAQPSAGASSSAHTQAPAPPPSARAITAAGPSTSSTTAKAPTAAPRAATPANTLAPWLAFSYTGSDEPDDLLVASSKDVVVRFWPPGAPVPRGVTFDSITVFLSETNRAAWKSLPGHILIAYPADAAHTKIDEFVHNIRLVCALVFADPAAVKVFPADINGDMHAPIALIRCSNRAQYKWLRDQQVVNNSRSPFFVISRNRLPARLTHTVSGGGWENDQESLNSLVGLYRAAAHASDELRDFANAHHEAAPPHVVDFHGFLANSITVDPLPILKKGRVPAIYWRVECARITVDKAAVKQLNGLVRKLTIRDDIYGTAQAIKALHCGMCGCVYHMLGMCSVAAVPSWLGPRPKTEENKSTPDDEEDEALPNAGLRLAAVRIKNATAAGKKGGKFDKKSKAKKF